MTKKIITKSMALFFITLITACSGGGGESSSGRQERAPSVSNNPDSNTGSAVTSNSGTSNSGTSSSGTSTAGNSADGNTTNTSLSAVTNNSAGTGVNVSSVTTSAPTPKSIKFSSAAGGGLHSLEGRAHQPAVLTGSSGKIVYAVGSDQLRTTSNGKARDNKKLADLYYDDSIFLNNNSVDPQKIQTLEVKDDKGNIVGTFQFVKQSQSQYMTFMPKVPRAQADDSVEYFSGIFSYIATPTSDSDFTSLKGQATYKGKVIGYKYPLKIGDKIASNYSSYDTLPSHPERATPADISLTVDFDNKKITGEITNRFDHLAARNWKFTDDNEKVTNNGLELDKKPLTLQGTIEKQGNVWGFIGPAGGSEGVYVSSDSSTSSKSVAGWGGIFAGEKAKEVVGVISSKERMTFGATKSEK